MIAQKTRGGADVMALSFVSLNIVSKFRGPLFGDVVEDMLYLLVV